MTLWFGSLAVGFARLSCQVFVWALCFPASFSGSLSGALWVQAPTGRSSCLGSGNFFFLHIQLLMHNVDKPQGPDMIQGTFLNYGATARPESVPNWRPKPLLSSGESYFIWGYYGTQYRVRLYPSLRYSLFFIRNTILLGSTTRKHYSGVYRAWSL